VALAPDDIVRLHSRKKIAALLMVEGGDFLAGDARYVRRAFTDGVRSITLVRQMPLLVSELLRRDYGAENTAAYLGGNFLRVFGKVWSGRSG
jgi:microsomal dipeptidase-like Zn-dependent dipeptidase